MKIHLISYGDDRYSFQREKFRTEAISSSFFDEVKMFSPRDLDHDFITRYREILNMRRGGGYWIWKPYLIKKYLDNVKDGDILIYCDAGCTINANGRKRYHEYLDQLISSATGIFGFKLHFKAYEYTKQEIFDYFQSPEEVLNSNLIVAGILLFRICAHSLMVIDKWFKTLEDDPWLFTDQLALINRHDGFIENRHDQSVYTVLVNTYGADIIPDETYFQDFERDGQEYPFWATRIKSGTLK